MKLVCEICGNEFERGASFCPFCGNKNEQSGEPLAAVYIQKTVNLEQGRPGLEVALKRMEDAIADARRNKINVLTFIHGYGSSGKGGVIRTECRKNLDFIKHKGGIHEFICGEDFNKRSSSVKSILRRHPELCGHKNMNRENKGITLVILS
ncbi:MAG: hypothetical protein COA36_09950 [Desulfotalea sp.]|nr:MAG: hypothetical protein COA36_09950 [Desulfotalea sp.]